MTGSAALKFKSNVLPEDYKAFDGNSGQSITLEELAESRAAEQAQKFQASSSFTDFLRERKEESWRIIIGKLRDLFGVDYDEDFLEPSQDILKTVAEFLFNANSAFTFGMPVPTFIVPDGDGGIKIEWRADDKHLRLSYSTRRNYLYLEPNTDVSGIENFNLTELIESLKWLNQIEY